MCESWRNAHSTPAIPSACESGECASLPPPLATQDRDARCLQAPRMTPCSGPASRRPAFLFDGHRCVPPSSVPPPGCLDGRNRFRSLGHCRSACQGPDARAECGEPAQLVACSREHVKRRWFYPVNGSCVEWAFPEGNCVSEAVGLFQRMGQCVHDCLEHDVAAPACGEAPVAQRCGDYQARDSTNAQPLVQ
ncbi:hypothetical protein HPB48_001928 [Haemaphysalis longicornis]|uniref:Uncharacterized protein n=1 Tax=Haemaphysalis longicornis TaxID=44386 RepID=A0A9J6G4M1_HAELO|nr:hypothetical protein HPB48_001928 [Haemaphysalis longicornis]